MSLDLVELVVGERGRGIWHDESPEWIPASSMCSMTAPMNTSRAVAHRVDVDLDRALEEPVDQDRVVGPAASAAVRTNRSSSSAP